MPTFEKLAVRVERIDGQWIVFVHGDGETTQRVFENEEWARNFAAGQRTRLMRKQAD